MQPIKPNRANRATGPIDPNPVKRVFHYPIGCGAAYTVTAFLVLARAVVSPGVLDLYPLVGGLLVAGAILQRRDARLWPFSVPRFAAITDFPVFPPIRTLFWGWQAVWWLAIIAGGCLLFEVVASLLMSWFAFSAADGSIGASRLGSA